MTKITQDTNLLPAEVREALDQMYPALIKLRRYIHREPELAWQEFKTTEKIEQFLAQHRPDKIYRPLKTGLVAEIINNKSSRFLGLRADIDALAIPDRKKVSYASKQSGISHSCGHDVHTTVMAGIAAILQKFKTRLPLNVRIVFQPAEEPIPSGAPKMIDQGVLTDLENIWAMHVEPGLPLGTVSLTSGWVNAQSIRLNWNIVGKGGHSARPDKTIDPIRATSRLIQEINQYFDKMPRTESIFAFTAVESKSAYNAIPDQAEIGGTLRITDITRKDQYLQAVEKFNRQIQQQFQVGIHFTAVSGAPPVVNDENVVKKFISMLKSIAPDQYQIVTNFRSMGGDDFGWYLQQVPGALIRFGIATNDKAPALHTGLFDVPEEIIPKAINFFLCQIFNWK